jgi:FdhE protein
MSRSLEKWDRRIQRANELAAAHPFAAEGLRFYERIAGFQKSLYADLLAGSIKERSPQTPGSLRGELDLPVLLPAFAPFLSLVQDVAPPPLAQSAAALSAAGGARWEEVLETFWRAGTLNTAPLAEADSLIAWTFLQPYAESLADRAAQLEGGAEVHGTPPLCPRCSGPPHVGVLRPLGDGAKRSLICSLCATEWDYRRIVCPACGEESVDKLPVYVPEGAEALSYVRVEACDTCRHYIKTIDLTKNGRAVPVVDELAAIPLSLWAGENGYSKVSSNLLGL